MAPDATPRSRRVSVAVDDMLTGCLPTSSRRATTHSHRGFGGHRGWPSHRLLQKPSDVDVAATLPSRCIGAATKTCSTPASGTAFRTTSGPFRARVSARFTKHQRDALGLIRATPFANIRKLGTRSRRTEGEPFMSCVGGHRGALILHLPDTLEIIRPPATTRRCRASVAF